MQFPQTDFETLEQAVIAKVVEVGKKAVGEKSLNDLINVLERKMPGEMEDFIRESCNPADERRKQIEHALNYFPDYKVTALATYLQAHLQRPEREEDLFYREGKEFLAEQMNIEPRNFSWLAMAEFCQESDRATLMAMLGKNESCLKNPALAGNIENRISPIDLNLVDMDKVRMQATRMVKQRMEKPEGDRKSYYMQMHKEVSALEAAYQSFSQFGSTRRGRQT